MDMSGMDMPGMDMPGMDMSNMGGATSSNSETGSTKATMDMSGMDMGGMSGMMDMMMNYYHFGHKEYILFYDLKTLSPGAMVGACFAIFAVSVLYEGLKVLREWLRHRLDTEPNVGVINRGFDNPFVASSHNQLSNKTFKKSQRRMIISVSHALQTFLHMFQLLLSYCLMLIVMTFNVWLLIAVIVGGGVGYFLFGWMKRSDDSESDDHCN